MLVDKYRPRTLDNLMVHKEEATNLKNLVSLIDMDMKVCRESVGRYGNFLVVLMSGVFWVSDSTGRSSSSSFLWTFWSGQEDPHHDIASRNVWTQC